MRDDFVFQKMRRIGFNETAKSIKIFMNCTSLPVPKKKKKMNRPTTTTTKSSIIVISHSMVMAYTGTHKHRANLIRLDVALKKPSIFLQTYPQYNHLSILCMQQPEFPDKTLFFVYKP
jgi:hypothetical protein